MLEAAARFILIRHGEAANHSPDGKDFSRPLTFSGQLMIKRGGQLLFDRDIKPDLIYCSTAKRTSETAAIIARETGFTGMIQPKPELYNCSPGVILELINKNIMPELVTCIVGHNPAVSDVRRLTTGGNRSLAPGDMVIIDANLNQTAVSFSLVDYLSS